MFCNCLTLSLSLLSLYNREREREEEVLLIRVVLHRSTTYYCFHGFISNSCYYTKLLYCVSCRNDSDRERPGHSESNQSMWEPTDTRSREIDRVWNDPAKKMHRNGTGGVFRAALATPYRMASHCIGTSSSSHSSCCMFAVVVVVPGDACSSLFSGR
mmetsp:Transcript_26021/g.55750  ORF Transcript_26021/g.55750 Transcript_26021/m.55750 type:complete len:157 (+) Transcript_26021:79-549(+)